MCYNGTNISPFERLLIMIIDVTGVELTPGNEGEFCKGNGEHFDENGDLIECCCDECDYVICCLVMKDYDDCDKCYDKLCPYSIINKE